MQRVTVVLNGFKRQNTLPEQIHALKNQTYPLERIMYWNLLSDNTKFQPDYQLLKREDIEYAETSHDYGTWGRITFALNADTDFICLLDDDVIPGPGYIQNCIDTYTKQPGVLGMMGSVLTRDTGRWVNYGWRDLNNPEPVQVLYLYQSHFFHRELLQLFWVEMPSWDLVCNRHLGEDIHITYVAQKRLGYKAYVVPHPKEDPSIWGNIAGHKYGIDEHAVHLSSIQPKTAIYLSLLASNHGFEIVTKESLEECLKYGEPVPQLAKELERAEYITELSTKWKKTLSLPKLNKDDLEELWKNLAQNQNIGILTVQEYKEWLNFQEVVEGGAYSIDPHTDKQTLIVNQLKNPALFWIDIYYLFQRTQYFSLDCAQILFEDLEQILSKSDFNNAVLINNARYFVGKSEISSHFPTIQEVQEFIRNLNPEMVCDTDPEISDIIRIYTPAKPAKINLIGPFTSLGIGIGEACHTLFQSLKEYSQNDIRCFDVESQLHLTCHIKDTTNQNSINIWHLNPNLHESCFKQIPKAKIKGYNIAFWYWEMSQIPDSWVPICEHLDEIWVGSSFCKKSIENKIKGQDLPISIIPPAINIILDPDIDRKYFNLPEESFLFLMMYAEDSMIERKNPYQAIQVFQKAFDPNDMSVGLVIKTHRNSVNHIEKIQQLIAENQNIYLIADSISREKNMSLISCCDAAISLHRAEGFGLFLAEAMALGKPVIATNWSGNLDFMKPDNSCLVNSKLVSLEAPLGPYEKGQVWAEPDSEHAIYYAQRLVADEYYRNSLGENAFIEITKNFSAEAQIAKISNILSKSKFKILTP